MPIGLTLRSHKDAQSGGEGESTSDQVRAAVVELIKAARAWDEYDGAVDTEEWGAVQERLTNAYRAFTEPYADDEYAEGVIASERTEEALSL